MNTCFDRERDKSEFAVASAFFVRFGLLKISNKTALLHLKSLKSWAVCGLYLFHPTVPVFLFFAGVLDLGGIILLVL